jgi:DNA-binding NarL/FixJ family response regulator
MSCEKSAYPKAAVAAPADSDVRVLIVDDNRSFADLLASSLDTVEGLDCVGTASSASEGFSQVAKLVPSVVVMDIMMPGVDGLAATRELRRMSPGTAVAVVSAHKDGAWIARAEDAGASAYIPKGGSLEEMIEVLKTVRPGAMVVAPSLRSMWASWQRPAPEPAPAPAAAPAQQRSGLRAKVKQARLQLKTTSERRGGRGTPSPVNPPW